jgi:hypothetical protein
MAIKKPTVSWLYFITKRYDELLNSQPVPFQELVPSRIPQVAGVYLITARKSRQEVPYYIGRTINLRRRLYTNHLMGPVANARLKRYLIGSGECKDVADAKRVIRDYCYVRWLEENNSRRRGAIEGYAVGLLFPKYGIYQEH